MTINDFIEHYSEESQCKACFIQYRFNSGVICKKCGSSDHYWLSTVEQFKCKGCGFRTTLRSGTVLQASKLPYSYWFMAMYLMTFTKKGLSALELQSQLGHKRYQPIWEMMHKLRVAMGKRDDQYNLSGELEMDEAFFKTVNELKKGEVIKRGKGSQLQTKVLVMAESERVPAALRKGKPRRCKYFKMEVIEDLKSETVNEVTGRQVDASSTVTTDDYPSYKKLHEQVKKHKPVNVERVSASRALPWVHVAISNSKRTLLSTYHRINGEYLQNYLNEFCYRLNRRHMKSNIFERLLAVVVIMTWFN